MTGARCSHPSPAVAHNAAGEPVRLICGCGRNWRVLPIEWAITVRSEEDAVTTTDTTRTETKGNAR